MVLRCFALLCCLPAVLACEAADQCAFPFNNPFTAAAAGNALPLDAPCCKVMPPLFLKQTGSKVVRPPTDGYCPPPPPDAVVIGSPLYNSTRVFFVGGLQWGAGASPLQGFELPLTYKPGSCGAPHSFYTKYTNAHAADVDYTLGIPILGSDAAPDAAILSASSTISELLRQIDVQLPALRLREQMVRHYQRMAVWADSERRFDTCEFCKRRDPSFDCNAHIDSRPGRDTSLHPEVPYCQEGGGAGKGMVTTFTEEYGICYLRSDGSIPASYSGTMIVAHEFFHSIHEVAIRTYDPVGFNMIEQACAKAFAEGIYQFHPGAPPDPEYTADFTTGMAYECMAKAVMTWHGFPASRPEFAPRSRADMKKQAPYLAEVVHRYFEDGDWNPCRGVRIDTPRDQTFNLTCVTAPGSALCGEKLSAEYIGVHMTEVLV